MKVVIRLTKREALKAMPILVRQSPAMVLRNRLYIVSEEAARALRAAGVRFTEVVREGSTPSNGDVNGERI